MSGNAETSLGRKRLISWFYANRMFYKPSGSSELGSDGGGRFLHSPHYLENLEIQTLRENNSSKTKNLLG